MHLVPCVLLAFAVGALADKEVIDSDTEDATSMLTERLWLQLVKRLKDYSYGNTDVNPLDRELDDEQCTYAFRNGTIIRTHDSIEGGATFINSQIGISKEDCTAECCSAANCNVAVFKEKDNDHSCYLFDCGTPNICKFTNHPGYTVIELPSRTTTNKVLEKHEDDLEQLAEMPTTTTSTTPKTTTVIITTQATVAPKERKPVSLFGKCEEHKDCAGSWSQCLGGYCVCKDGYHEQEGTCRKDCSKFEFECRNTGQPLVYPQCVAIYNKCDGIPLCKDGSDEEDCDSNGKKANHLKQKQLETSKGNHLDTDDDYSMVTKQDIPVPPKISDNSETKLDESLSQEPRKLGQAASSRDDDHSTTKNTKEKDQTDPSAETKKQSVSHDDERYENKLATEDHSESSKNPVDDAGNDSVVAKQEPKVSDNLQSLGSVVQVVLAEDGNGNLDKAVDDTNVLRGFYHSSKGAVVALSLGLCITAMLLIFIGCRLRNVKKRLRRGRPLNSNEADYLINGMYL